MPHACRGNVAKLRYQLVGPRKSYFTLEWVRPNNRNCLGASQIKSPSNILLPSWSKAIVFADDVCKESVKLMTISSCFLCFLSHTHALYWQIVWYWPMVELYVLMRTLGNLPPYAEQLLRAPHIHESRTYGGCVFKSCRSMWPGS